MNISRLRINCSSIASLVANPKGNTPVTENELKEFVRIVNKEIHTITQPQLLKLYDIIKKKVYYDEDKLSDTVKAEVAKIYALEVYNCGSISNGGNWMPMEKGVTAEEDAIKLLSEIDGQTYKKNERLIKNAWFKGIPDIIVKEDGQLKKVIDIKIPIDLPAFFQLINEGPDPHHVWQMRGYLNITGCEVGEIVHCLVNMPPAMFNAEKEKVIDRAIAAGVPQDEIIRRIDILTASMHYDHIPLSQKVFRNTIYNDQTLIKMAKARVKLVRRWLTDLDNSFKKPLTLIPEDGNTE